MRKLVILSFVVACVLGAFTGSRMLHNQNFFDSDAQAVAQGGRRSSNPLIQKSLNELASFRAFPFDFDSTTIEGESLRKSDFAGRVLIVDIWATWCPPCRAEIPSFVELQTKYEDQGLSIVGLNYERARTRDNAILTINEFRRTQPINYPLVLGDESLTGQIPDFSGFPTTLFIDGKGKVRMMLVGAHPRETLEAYVTTLLAELEMPSAVPPGARQKQHLPTEIKSTSTPQENPYLQSSNFQDETSFQ